MQRTLQVIGMPKRLKLLIRHPLVATGEATVLGEDRRRSYRDQRFVLSSGRESAEGLDPGRLNPHIFSLAGLIVRLQGTHS